MNFHELMQPVAKTSVFALEGYLVWCPTMVRTEDGTCHLLFSFWPESLGHDAWVTHSKVGYATADDPLGPYRYQGIVLQGSGGNRWDAHCIHNPTMIEEGGKYYLYYMGNYGDGHYWTHRNNQRIGVAVADHPSGPWRTFDKPLIDVTPCAWDHLMVSNPTVVKGPNGKFVMVYKGVGQGPLPEGGAVVCGVAVAEHPLGPFDKIAGPIMVNPENDWSVEDPYIWCQEGRFYALVKDFQGYFTKGGQGSVALFVSEDGVNWHSAPHPFAFNRQLHWENGDVQQVERLERPQIWLHDGKPKVLFCAVGEGENLGKSYIVAIPLRSS